VVAKDETLAAMMATRTYRQPVAGEVTNTNALLGHDGFVGMKTGSDEAVDRLAPNAGPPETPSMPGMAGRLSAGQPGLATPAAAYRRHIENHIRAGNTTLR
jgi:hypothetical protein